MGNLLECIYDLLMKPKTAVVDIANNQTVGRALQIVLLTTLLAALGSYAEFFTGGAKLAMVSVQVCANISFWGISVAIWHLLAELLGGTGSVKKLLTVIGFIYFLQILLAPIYLLAAFIPTGGLLLIVLATIIIMVWSLVLEVYAISAVYQLSGLKATLVIFLPVLILIGCLVIIGVMTSAFLMVLFEEIMANPPQFYG